MSFEPQPQEIIDGNRIQLRARCMDHAEELFSLIDLNREHLQTWLPFPKTTVVVDDTKNYLELAIDWWKKSESFDYSVFQKSSGKMIGSFGLHSIQWEKRTCEFGYWIALEHQGQGYIAEAVRLGEQIALSLGFHRIIIGCDRLNARSQQIPKKLGYTLESLQIDERVQHGNFRDSLRFVKLMNPEVPGHITEQLPDGYSIKSCTSEEFGALVDKHLERIFDEKELIFRTRDILCDSEKSKLKSLNENFGHPYILHLLIHYKGKLAGWTWGYQDSRESFYMVNSAVLEEHRGRGLYKRLLEVAKNLLIEKGYQRIWSRHNITNNAIIVPKMKAGFLITGTELSDVFGSLIHLTYFSNPTRQKILNFRAGSVRPDQELKEIFKI